MKKLICIGYRPGRKNRMIERVEVDVFGLKTTIKGTIKDLHRKYDKSLTRSH